jgi:hypothetical protein
VNTHGINILDKTDGDHLVVGIADDLQLQFLPTQDGFFYEYLAYETCRDTAACNGLQLFLIICNSTSRASKGIGGPHYHRISELLRDSEGLLQGVSKGALRHIYAQAIHGLLELTPVFTAFYGIRLNPYDPDAVLLEDTPFR